MSKPPTFKPITYQSLSDDQCNLIVTNKDGSETLWAGIVEKDYIRRALKFNAVDTIDIVFKDNQPMEWDSERYIREAIKVLRDKNGTVHTEPERVRLALSLMEKSID